MANFKNPNNSLTPSLTELINRYRNEKITRGQRKFLQIAYDVNAKQKLSFCVEYFREKGYRDNLFRQYVHQLKDMIIIECKSNPVSYKLKGIRLSIHDKKITDKGMGAGAMSLQESLDMLKYFPPQIHDIRIKFPSKNLHKILYQFRKISPMKQNNQIHLEYPYPNAIDAQRILCQISPKSVQIMISNTYNPLYCDPGGIYDLGVTLGHIRDYLLHRSDPNFVEIPNVHDWIVSMYHFNKDGITRSGQTAEITISDFNSKMLRFYTKKMPDGTKKDRLEKLLTPNIPIKQLFRDTLGLNEKSNITIIIYGGITSL